MIRRKAEWWLIPGIKSVNGWNYSSVSGLLPQSAALNFVTNKGASGRPDSIYSVGSMQEWAELCCDNPRVATYPKQFNHQGHEGTRRNLECGFG